MRVSYSMLAAGLATCALAAPGVERRSCKGKPSSSSEASTAAAAAPTVASSSSSSSSVAAVAATTPASSSSSSSSAAAVATTTSAETTNIAAASSTSSSTASAASSAASSSASGTSGGFKFLGASESGAEFGTAIPGTYGTDFIFPNTTAIQVLIDDMGMNVFRLPFLMERMAPDEMTATLDANYLANLTTVVNYITEAGKYAVLDPHNYARYDGSIISSTSDFQTFWTNLATEFASNDKVIFDCNNEPHDMSTDTQTAELMQACIDGVRGAGATSQYIFVEGTSYTGAWTWTTSGNSDYMGNLTDTVDDLLVYEMHQYLDSDGSGTSGTCVSTTIGAERIEAATTWLRDNNKVGIIGEFAGGANADCETAITGMLDSMTESTDVWLGAMWWGAGPWWGSTYFCSIEPADGVAFDAYKSILANYAPSS